jgi:REP element-mobilizing transposase RayT
MDYRYGSHTVYNIEYHFVWVTKYRYKVLTGDVAHAYGNWSGKPAKSSRSRS